jgi:hypothetical protein
MFADKNGGYYFKRIVAISDSIATSIEKIPEVKFYGTLSSSSLKTHNAMFEINNTQPRE